MSNNCFSRSIVVRFQKEGIHQYPAAVNIPGVEFLAHPHRHLFWFEVQIEVFHNDRDLEFIIEKRWMESLYSGILELNHKSCEMMAEELFEQLNMRYTGDIRRISISVFEDNENGAVLNFRTT